MLQSINVIKSWARNSCVCAPQIKDINFIKDSWFADQKYLIAPHPCLHVCVSFWQEKTGRIAQLNQGTGNFFEQIVAGLDLGIQINSATLLFGNSEVEEIWTKLKIAYLTYVLHFWEYIHIHVILY